MEPAGATYVFCDSLLLVKAGGLEPAGAEALPELRKTRAVLETFTVRPQGWICTGQAGAADAREASPSAAGWADSRWSCW